MLAKIMAAVAAIILLTGSALASGSTISGLHEQQAATSNQSLYASHNSMRGQRYAAAPAPDGYKDAQGSHALGGGPG
jgi:hypothetical protein